MGRAEALEKAYYKRRAKTTDRFKKGIQPFYYYYLIWKKLPFYTEDYVMRSPNSNRNWMILEQLEYIRDNVDSFRVVVTGPEGSGKTMLILAVGHLVRDWDGKGGQVHLAWGPVGFCKVFEDGLVQDNDVVVPDEMKVHLEGEDSKKILWRTENIMTINRKRRIHYVIGSKELRSFFPVLAEFKICGKDKKKRETQFLFYLGGKLIGKGYIPIRDLEGYTKMEEKYKDEFIKMIERKGGAATVHGERQEEEMIFSYEATNIRDFIVDNARKEDLKQILEGVFTDVNQTKIGKKLGVTQYAISKRLQHFGESKLGYIAEKYFMNLFGDQRDFLSRAPQGVPDVIGRDGRIHSVKCYLGYKNSQIIRIVEDCQPELQHCLKNKIDSFRLIFANPIWKDGYMYYDVDVKSPPNWVSFRKDGRIVTG